MVKKGHHDLLELLLRVLHSDVLHSILSWSENFERWWRKSIVAIDYRSYRKFFFNFLDWTLTYQVSSSSKNVHGLLI